MGIAPLARSWAARAARCHRYHRPRIRRQHCRHSRRSIRRCRRCRPSFRCNPCNPALCPPHRRRLSSHRLRMHRPSHPIPPANRFTRPHQRTYHRPRPTRTVPTNRRRPLDRLIRHRLRHCRRFPCTQATPSRSPATCTPRREPRSVRIVIIPRALAIQRQ